MAIPLLGSPRATLARVVRERVAGSDFEAAAESIWAAEGERWFTEADPIWQVHADTSMFIGGIRALLLQSLHPVAMLGVIENSAFRDDPWGRLQRTSTFLAVTTYGTIPNAERSIEIVKAIHRRVTGVTPAGVPYRADDPHLLMWIHAAGVDSFLACYQSFGDRRLSPAAADSYVQQSGVVAERLGVVNPPQSVAELAEVLESFRPELGASQPAKEAAEFLLTDPPMAGLERAGYWVLAAGAVSTLPAWVRSELRLPTLPITDRALVRPLARSATRTLRWALSS